MDIRLLEDKLTHCQENLNFVAGELHKIKSKDFPKNRFTTLDRVIIWLTDYHYETCEIREIALHQDEPRYYLRRINSTLTGVFRCVSESWYGESSIYANTDELKKYLKDRIDKYVK